MTDLKNIQQHKKFKILLIGDSCVDEYYYGSCDRLNPEAPVPVLNVTRHETKLGMAANVKDNLETLGCVVDFITSDEISIKRRYIDDRSKQHIVRVDEDKVSLPCDKQFTSAECNLYDAIVISDYNKGFVSYELIETINKIYNGHVFVDTKKQDLTRLEGCYVKINEAEDNAKVSSCGNLIVTLGERGASYRGIIYPTEKVTVVDVCGAGDTFLAALVFYYLQTHVIEYAIEFANKCSAIAITHRSVYTLTEKDIYSLKN
jgi:D-beta-D-heptose 7-phosphate kinase/D-beta-D-heptose 1-phosphate adenosyltransferase